MAMVETVPWLVTEKIYPTIPAARMGILRGDIPRECIIRRGRRVFLLPEKVKAWVEAGMPRASVPDLRRRRS